MSLTIDFGIDLGTTNSLIAKFVNGSVEIFKNPGTWKDTTPSVVAFRKDRILVGDRARAFQEKDPANVVGHFKRKMGTTESFPIGHAREPKTPVELSAHVLKELKTFIQTGENVDSAVITVPASFDVIQSNATKKAAEEAGFKSVVLLQEPIAASLAYANQASSREFTDGKWLVYDLGGGTFDVALVKIENGEMRVLDHEGDNFLGGTDFDRLIIENFIVPHISKHHENVDMASDFQSASGKYNALFFALMHKAEEAKKELSNRTSTEIEFEFEGEDVVVEITRSDFEGIIREPIARTAEMVRSILTRNSLTPRDLSFILLVGGSTYIPYIRSRIEELAQIPVKTDIDPTTAIVSGAAYFAGTQEKQIIASADNFENNSGLIVKAVYEKTSKDSTEPFFARVTGETSGLFYRILRSDGGFDTGLRELKERISEDLRLVPDSYNHFKFTTFDDRNNEVDTNFREFQIAHNIIGVSGQPLPEDICIELDDIENETSHLRLIFPRNTILPAKSPTVTVSATRSVSKGSLDDALYINVLEGDSSYLPESVKHIGTLEIGSSELNRDLLKGAEIELMFEVSESRDVTVSAYIQHSDQAFKQVFQPKEREVKTEWLQRDVESLLDKIDSHAEEAKRRDDTELLRELRVLAKEVDRLEDRALCLSNDDVTDVKFQLEDEKNRLARQVNTSIQSRRAEILLDEYFDIKEQCSNLIAESGSDRNREHFTEIVEGESQFVRPPSPPLLKAKIGELHNLYFSVLWRQPKFLTAEFNWIVEQEKLNDSDSVQKLIEQGQIAIIDNDFDSLRGIIFRLYDMMPKEKRRRREAKTGIG